MIWDDSDRRIAPRYACSIPARFRLEDGSLHDGEIGNISATGMLLITHEPIARGSRLYVKPDAPKLDVELEGLVVRFAPAGSFGVAFIDVTAGGLDALHSLTAR